MASKTRAGYRLMYFDSVQAALQMAGHGPYVWGAYGGTLVVIAILIIVPVRHARAARRQLAAELRRQSSVQTSNNRDADASKT